VLKLITKLIISVVLTVCIVFIVRLMSDYLSSIILVDYLAYSGIGLLLIAGVSGDKGNIVNRDFLTLMTQRELVTRDVNADNDVNRITLSLSLGASGVLCLVISGLLALLY